MAARKAAYVQLVQQVNEHLVREEKYWKRVEKYAMLLTDEEITAKEEIIQTIFNLGAGAAARIGSKSVMESLLWQYRTVYMEIQDTRRRLQRKYW